jgi:hypothetical protein
MAFLPLLDSAYLLAATSTVVVIVFEIRASIVTLIFIVIAARPIPIDTLLFALLLTWQAAEHAGRAPLHLGAPALAVGAAVA